MPPAETANRGLLRRVVELERGVQHLQQEGAGCVSVPVVDGHSLPRSRLCDHAGFVGARDRGSASRGLRFLEAPRSGRSRARNRPRRGDSEHVESGRLLHAHHQELGARVQRADPARRVRGALPVRGVPHPPAHHRRLWAGGRHGAQLQPRLAGAVVSNVAFVFRNVVSKRGVGMHEEGNNKHVGGVNYYACLSIMSLAFVTPFAFAFEGPKAWAAGWKAAKLAYGNQVIWWLVTQSVFYHLYNQVSYMSLDKISPLTFSISNTIKHVTVIVSSIIIFHTKILPINVVGAAIAIFGTFLYSQIKQ